VTTSDSADFAKPRVTPKPMVFAVEQVKIKDRGAYDDLVRIEQYGGRTGNSPNFCGRQNRDNCR